MKSYSLGLTRSEKTYDIDTAQMENFVLYRVVESPSHTIDNDIVMRIDGYNLVNLSKGYAMSILSYVAKKTEVAELDIGETVTLTMIR